jgi:hypothetical protein
VAFFERMQGVAQNSERSNRHTTGGKKTAHTGATQDVKWKQRLFLDRCAASAKTFWQAAASRWATLLDSPGP